MLEREHAYLQEINPNQFLSSLDENSNAKGDLEEIERLIKEADCKESFKNVEDSLTRRVDTKNPNLMEILVCKPLVPFVNRMCMFCMIT